MELVDAYLVEIAKAYSVIWSPAPSREAAIGDDPDGGVKVSSSATHWMPFLIFPRMQEETADSSEILLPRGDATLSPDGNKTPKLPDIPPTEDETEAKKPAKAATPPPIYKAPEDDFDALTRRFEALKKR